MLASSGIDPVIRLWAPLPEDGEEEDCLVKDMEKVGRTTVVFDLQRFGFVDCHLLSGYLIFLLSDLSVCTIYLLV